MRTGISGDRPKSFLRKSNSCEIATFTPPVSPAAVGEGRPQRNLPASVPPRHPRVSDRTAPLPRDQGVAPQSTPWGEISIAPVPRGEVLKTLERFNQNVYAFLAPAGSVNPVWTEQFQSRMADFTETSTAGNFSGFPTYRAMLGDNTVGLMSLFKNNKDYTLLGLVGHPGVSGIAAPMVRYAAAKSLEDGNGGRLVLVPASDNARPLYEALGFRPNGAGMRFGPPSPPL